MFYSDEHLQFSYPDTMRLDAGPQMRVYTFRVKRSARTKGSSIKPTMILSLLPSDVAAGSFRGSISAPAPPGRSKTVLQEASLGGRQGQALRFDVRSPEGDLAMVCFDYRIPISSQIVARVEAHLPTEEDVEVFGEILRTLRLAQG